MAAAQDGLDMDEAIISEAIGRQYAALFAMLRSAIERCPDDLWARQLDEAAYWRQALHAILSTQMYLYESPQDPALRRDGERLLRELGMPSADPPVRLDELRAVLQKMTEKDFDPPAVLTKGTLMAYVADTQRLCELRLAEQDKLAGANGFGWTGPTVVERLIYNFRHAQHHAGRLHSILGRHGVRMQWICTGG